MSMKNSSDNIENRTRDLNYDGTIIYKILKKNFQNKFVTQGETVLILKEKSLSQISESEN
jgi:translation initiation factor 2 beta subunit (eIF-2beta)/eIF-5